MKCGGGGGGGVGGGAGVGGDHCGHVGSGNPQNGNLHQPVERAVQSGASPTRLDAEIVALSMPPPTISNDALVLDSTLPCDKTEPQGVARNVKVDDPSSWKN